MSPAYTIPSEVLTEVVVEIREADSQLATVHARLQALTETGALTWSEATSIRRELGALSRRIADITDLTEKYVAEEN